MRTLGILGTMVWDRIFPHDGGDRIEAWGGIGYALEAAEAALPDGWRILPLIKIGRDLADEGHAFLATLPRVDVATGVRVVDSPNNRVELRYRDQDRRIERLSGGVPGWTAEELAPLARRTDALYINFISGVELDLEAATRLRRRYPRPLYADLHSLLLATEADGRRTPRRLPDWRAWLRCFDAVQVNEGELGRLGPASEDPWSAVGSAVTGDPLRLLFVTLGARGAAWLASPSAVDDPLGGAERHRVGGEAAGRLAGERRVRPEVVPVEDDARAGDPTGCGDVWGATCFARLLAGDAVRDAVRAANAAAARNVESRGAEGLHRLLGEPIES